MAITGAVAVTATTTLDNSNAYNLLATTGQRADEMYRGHLDNYAFYTGDGDYGKGASEAAQMAKWIPVRKVMADSPKYMKVTMELLEEVRRA